MALKAVNKNIETECVLLTVVAWALNWRESISSALPVPTVLIQRKVSVTEKRKTRRKKIIDKTMTDLAEPEDLLSGFGVAFTAHPDVQSLFDSNRTWLVSWVGWHRAMAHLHELDLLELC